MAVTATATQSLNISYSIVDTNTDTSFTESALIGYTTLTYENGTGIGQINAGVSTTGTLSSGGTGVFDFNNYTKNLFNNTMAMNFASSGSVASPSNPAYGIKGIIITNTWSTTGTGLGMLTADIPYFTIAATGIDGFSGLFNNESGNINIVPTGTWAYMDDIGKTPIYNAYTSTYNNKISLIDSGSGVPYEILVVGVTGTN